jgi:hypothetical protein
MTNRILYTWRFYNLNKLKNIGKLEKDRNPLRGQLGEAEIHGPHADPLGLSICSPIINQHLICVWGYGGHGDIRGE